MSASLTYNKLITQAAKTTLTPLGIFQKGQSRIWIDDNGWFLIVIEFQPSNWSQGSFLNVSIHYLWSTQKYLSFDYGGRLHNFVPYNGDDQTFFDDIIMLSEKAIEKVTQYRKFGEICFAKEQIIQSNQASTSKNIYQKMMICGLAKDHRAYDFYEKLMAETQYSSLGYDIDYYKELTQEIKQNIEDVDAFSNYIINKIVLQRNYWRTKTGMKKLKPLTVQNLQELILHK